MAGLGLAGSITAQLEAVSVDISSLGSVAELADDASVASVQADGDFLS